MISNSLISRLCLLVARTAARRLEYGLIPDPGGARESNSFSPARQHPASRKATPENDQDSPTGSILDQRRCRQRKGKLSFPDGFLFQYGAQPDPRNNDAAVQTLIAGLAPWRFHNSPSHRHHDLGRDVQLARWGRHTA